MLIRTALGRLMLTSTTRCGHHTIVLRVESKGTFLPPVGGLMIRVAGDSKVQIASFGSDGEVRGYYSYLYYIILYDGI